MHKKKHKQMQASTNANQLRHLSTQACTDRSQCHPRRGSQNESQVHAGEQAKTLVSCSPSSPTCGVCLYSSFLRRLPEPCIYSHSPSLSATAALPQLLPPLRLTQAVLCTQSPPGSTSLAPQHSHAPLHLLMAMPCPYVIPPLLPAPSPHTPAPT